jgi:arginase
MSISSTIPNRVALLGVPIDMGASQRGTLMGPDALLPIADDPLPNNVNHYREIQSWVRALSPRAYELARSGATPIFLGGDHSLSMGSIRHVRRIPVRRARPRSFARR